ncbi:hypothetical protein BH23CHL2_BH23CHL2_08210 [soil metagenome]
MARNTSQPGSRTNQPTEDTARKPGRSTRRRKIALSTGLAILILLVASTATGAATKVYSIIYGDTLNGIAAEHGTDVATLVGLNDIDDPDMIIAGGELQVPDGDLTSYTVRKGDTLAGVAAMYGVDVRELIAVNKIEDADIIHPGEVLLVYQPHDDSADGTSENVDANANEAGLDSSSEEATDKEAADEPSSEGSGADADSEAASASESGRLHLVRDGETLADVAAAYNVTEAQLIAANALASSEITAGMILKIPPAASTGVELIGMPARQEQWPLMSELAAASIATAYWGAPVSSADLLEQLDRSENPHLGFRGNPQGMFGTTEDYGVYNGPLADALAEFGFTADAFYADGDRSALTSRIDAGKPVVVWVTHNLEIQERIVVESDLGRYSLIPEQHAVVVYGYDNTGVNVMDVSAGTSAVWNWDEFMASWSLFDGMGLAIELQ